MTDRASAAERWDRIWREREHPVGQPARVLEELAPWLPERGRALDLAGGAGRNALWLRDRGLEVVVCDGSAEGLKLAAAQGLRTLQRDVEVEGPPPGPWDLVFIHHFLHRPVFGALDLAPGGLVVVVHPTVRNLERHQRPSRRWLLEEGELSTLLGHLRLLHAAEGWGTEGRHEAVAVARAPGA